MWQPRAKSLFSIEHVQWVHCFWDVDKIQDGHVWACIFTCLAFRQTVKSQSEMSAIWIQMWSHHFPNWTAKWAHWNWKRRMDMWTAKWAHWNWKQDGHVWAANVCLHVLHMTIKSQWERIGIENAGWTCEPHSGSALEQTGWTCEQQSERIGTKRRMDMWATKWAQWKGYTVSHRV